MYPHGSVAPIERGDRVAKLLGDLMERARDGGSRYARNSRVGGLVAKNRRPATSRYLPKVITGQPVLVPQGFQSFSRRSLWGHDKEL